MKPGAATNSVRPALIVLVCLCVGNFVFLYLQNASLSRMPALISILITLTAFFLAWKAGATAKTEDPVLAKTETATPDWQRELDAKTVELAFTRKKLQDTVEHISEAYLALDRDWNYTTINKKAREFFNMDAEALIGKNIWEQFPESRESPFYEAYLKASKTGEDVFLQAYYPPFDRWFENHIYPSADGLAIFLKDITDQKKAQEAVIESEKRYHTLTEVSPVGIFHTDIAGNTTYVNPRWCEIAGLSKGEAMGSGWLKAVHPQDKIKVFSGWQEATQHSKPSSSEYRFVHPDGNTVWVIGQAIPEWNSDNEIIGYIGNITDITARKEAEEEMRLANERFEMIAQATNDMIWDWNLVTNELWWNNNYYSLFGKEEQPGIRNIDSWNKRLHPDDRERVLTRIHDAINLGEVLWQDEYRYLKDDGTVVYVYDRGYITHDRKGVPNRMIGSMLNVTELKKAQEDITKEKNLSDSIINSLPGNFYLYTAEGKFLRWNDNLEKVTLYSAAEIEKMHPLELFSEDEKQAVADKIALTFQSGEAQLQANLLTKTGVRIPYYFTGRYINYGGQPCLLGVGIDFSERIGAQEKAQEASEQLRRLALHLQNVREEERKRIGREIHDELGQQLTAVKMDIAWLDKKIPEDSGLVKHKLKNVIHLLDEGNKSVRRILSELRSGVLEDNGLLDALQWLIRQFTATTHIPVKFDVPDIEINPSRPVANCIFRAYQEAFTNITRYARPSKVTASLRVENGRLVTEITDDGLGFDMSKVAHEKSFGILGMKERVLSLKGQFDLVSYPGNGTKIIISLPAEK